MKMEQYQAPDVPRERLPEITEIKNSAQTLLMERMFGHFPSDDEGMEWIEKYAEDLNFFFVEHPNTTVDDIKKIEEYLFEKKEIILH